MSSVKVFREKPFYFHSSKCTDLFRDTSGVSSHTLPNLFRETYFFPLTLAERLLDERCHLDS